MSITSNMLMFIIISLSSHMISWHLHPLLFFMFYLYIISYLDTIFNTNCSNCNYYLLWYVFKSLIYDITEKFRINLFHNFAFYVIIFICYFMNASIAQLDRAAAFEVACQGFESLWVHQQRLSAVQRRAFLLQYGNFFK